MPILLPLCQCNSLIWQHPTSYCCVPVHESALCFETFLLTCASVLSVHKHMNVHMNARASVLIVFLTFKVSTPPPAKQATLPASIASTDNRTNTLKGEHKHLFPAFFQDSWSGVQQALYHALLNHYSVLT